MAPHRRRIARPRKGPAALKVALDQSEVLKAKVEACADDLGSANDSMKKGIASGATMLAAHTLAATEKVEVQVQECAGELHQVNEHLARGIEDLRQTENALTASRQELAVTENALSSVQTEADAARLRALHDSLTGLPNLDLFDDRLTHAISLAERHDWTLAVMFLDLDRFKSINDDYGHAAGDFVLKQVAKRLLQHARAEDTVCRKSGDEFLYLLMNPRGGQNIKRIAIAVLESIARPIAFGDSTFVVKLSIGVAVYPNQGSTRAELIGNADIAMYQAKKAGAGYAFFEDGQTLSPRPEPLAPGTV